MNDLVNNLNATLMKTFGMTENVVHDINIIDGEIVEGVSTLEGTSKTSENDKKLEEDIEKSRINVSNLIKRSDSALQAAISLASTSDSPRAIEALATLLKTMGDLNSSILDVHVKAETIKQKRRSGETGDSQPHNQTNVQNIAVFNGTTEEALELLKSKKS